ncbi:MAG TPA: type 4a pilus biogenesis protein PilO [Clostridia bacterium]|nr:type 4a pilus biogenesis protein PilO [Clostridia bacterium]
MAKFNDLPQPVQIGILFAIAVVIVIGAYFSMIKPIDDGNRSDQVTLKAKQAEIAQLSPYENKVVELDRQIETLKQQLDLQKRIVPDDKEVPAFINVVQAEATKSGIEIRRYTSKPAVTREFYTEVPFEMDVDGPYYAVLDFFQRVAKLERIVNVSDVAMAQVKKAQAAKVKKQYPYAPNETVVASYVATTFFSNTTPAPAAPPAKK